MGRNCVRLIIPLLCWFIFLLIGCAGTPEGNRNSSGIYVPFISSIKPEEYPEEIEKNRKTLQSNLRVDIQQQAHLSLASLYSSPLNPDRNFELARKQLEIYALLDPDFKNAVDPRTLLAALIEIEKVSTLATSQALEMQKLSQKLDILEKQSAASMGYRQNYREENLKLNNRIRKLESKIRRLEASNHQLKNTIDMLGTLDSQLEEKRSNFIKKDRTDQN